MTKTTQFQREQLNSVKFSFDNDFNTPEFEAKKNIDLRKGMLLGNLYKTKVKITFKTASNQVAYVFARIWSVSEKYISVYGGANIPKRSILDVSLTTA